MHPSILQAVIPELQDALLRRTVTGVQYLGRFAVLVRFGDRAGDLVASAHPEWSRLSLWGRDEGGGAPRPAPDNLAKTLAGASLTGITQESAGRVATLTFERAGAEHATLRLVAELIPRFANVILTGNDGKILWARRTFEGERERNVAAGQKYVAPKPDDTLPFAELTANALEKRLSSGEGPPHRRIPRQWGGGARGFARIWEADDGFTSRLLDLARRSSTPSPCILRHESGEETLLPSTPEAIPTGWSSVTTESAVDTIERYFGARERDEERDQLASELRRTLTKRRNKAARALEQIAKRMESALQESVVRQRAELLAANLGKISRGMKAVSLSDFETGDEVVVELDPKLDPQSNVEALFKKARRLGRGHEEMIAQRSIQEAEIEDLDSGLSKLDPLPPIDALRELVGELAPSLLKKDIRTSGATKKKAEPKEPELAPGFRPRRYELEGGWEVWVGRSAKQNDELSHRHAKQNDLWFHARGSQGSHTILRRMSGKGEPPKNVILQAAAIAAYHSKARNSKLVPVAYTEKRYVRKPRKAPVGTAVMMREKVVMVEPKLPDDSR